MTAGLAFDVVVVLLILALACWTITTRNAFAAVAGFVGYGMLLALAWVRLSAVDVALTEAAVGSGVTGVLLLGAATQTRRDIVPSDRPSALLRLVAAALCMLLAAALALVVLDAPNPPPSLAEPAAQALSATGLGNPVTAVLMAYRAIDTFLEKVVLLLALIGVWSLAPDSGWGRAPTMSGGIQRDDVLTFLAQMLPAVGIVVGLYIFWNGANHPGGAFQGGALLAAMWMLTMLAGLAKAPRMDGSLLRAGLVIGPGAFLAVGLAGLAVADAFLAYPPTYAKPLIIVIETAMIVTIAVTLGLLVAGSPRGKR